MSNYNVSSRYAKALIEMSSDAGTFEKVSEDVEVVYNSLVQSKELRSVLKSPVIGEEKKISILNEIFQSRVSADTMNFLRFIVKKNREGMVTDIMRRYIDIKNDKLNILDVHAISSSEMNDEQKKVLKTQMETRTGKNVNLSFGVDENIIGGFKLRMKDTVIDASVQNQLNQLRKSFLGEKMISTN